MGGEGSKDRNACTGKDAPGLNAYCYDAGYSQTKGTSTPDPVGEGIQAAMCRATKESEICYNKGAYDGTSGVSSGDSSFGVKSRSDGHHGGESRDTKETKKTASLVPSAYPHGVRPPQVESFAGQLLSVQREIDLVQRKYDLEKGKCSVALEEGSLRSLNERKLQIMKQIEEFGERPVDDGYLIGTVIDQYQAQDAYSISMTYKRSLRQLQGCNIWVPASGSGDKSSYEKQGDGTFLQRKPEYKREYSRGGR
jgi:hypothetical protein